MCIVATLFKQTKFELAIITKLKSYCEQQEQLKDIVKEEDKLVYGGRVSGKLGQAVCTWSCFINTL